MVCFLKLNRNNIISWYKIKYSKVRIIYRFA